MLANPMKALHGYLIMSNISYSKIDHFKFHELIKEAEEIDLEIVEACFVEVESQTLENLCELNKCVVYKECDGLLTVSKLKGLDLTYT